MIGRALLILSAGLALGVCTAVDARPVQVQADPAVAYADNSDGIVLAVDNPVTPAPPRAASNLLGYTNTKYYGAGQQATATLEAIKRRYRLRQLAGWAIKPLGLYCVLLEPAPGISRQAQLQALAQDPRVQLVQPLQDFAMHSDPRPDGAAPALARYNDPYIDLQSGFIATDAAAAQQLSEGRGVDVALVDTGVDLRHPDLDGRIREARDLVGSDPAAFGRDRHGTEVAGIIAADSNNHVGIVGMAPKAMLSVYKACWYPADTPAADARCNSFTLAKALAAIADGPARIVNLSLGGPADPLLGKLLEHLQEQGRIVVASLPPSGRPEGFPSDAPGVIVVRNDRSRDPAPAGVLNAPGTDILTTQPAGRYDFSSGSSMAAAHVSGIAAMLLALSPRLDAASLHGLLERSSRPFQGTPEVNARAALDLLAAPAGAAR